MPAESSAAPLSNITSGALYQAVMQIDLDISLQESDTCLYVMRDISSGEVKTNIRQFFWDIVQISELPAIWDSYSNMSCTFMYGDEMGNVGISNYNSLLDFKTTHLNLIQDSDTAALFDVFYNAVYGARDISIAQDKLLYDLSQQTGTTGYELPADYRAGYLWVYSCFNSSCGYEVQDNSISVQIIAENSESAGAQAAQELSAAVEKFNQLCNNDNLSMPYTKISVQYQDAAGTTKLWDWCSEKTEDSWSVTVNKSDSADFAAGIKSAAN